ncbi:MAG: hypothetical protein IKU34_07530 [Clostridia bacterium]|nr:hypothetical protein [Clostridia bacterium]
MNAGDERLDNDLVFSQVRDADQDVYEADSYEQEWAEHEQEEKQEVIERLERWRALKGYRAARRAYALLCVTICMIMIVVLLYTVGSLPAYGDPNHPINNEVSARYIEKGLQETGAVNIVTGMILDYRAFDTLGESTVLFTGAMVVLFLLRADAQSHKYSALAQTMKDSPHSETFYEPHRDVILQKTAMILVPVVLIFGVYVVLNGHLSPGGGFSGGAIMGAGLMLYVTAFGFASIRRFFTYKTYQFVVLIALLTYAMSKCYSFYTGANHIESIIPLGTPGAILSSGLILVLNICVGFVVTCTMYAFYAMFRKGEM